MSRRVLPLRGRHAGAGSASGFGSLGHRRNRKSVGEKGIREVVFLVDKGSEDAEAFWAAMGVKPIRSTTPYFGRLKRADLG